MYTLDIYDICYILLNIYIYLFIYLFRYVPLYFENVKFVLYKLYCTNMYA